MAIREGEGREIDEGLSSRVYGFSLAHTDIGCLRIMGNGILYSEGKGRNNKEVL